MSGIRSGLIGWMLAIGLAGLAWAQVSEDTTPPEIVQGQSGECGQTIEGAGSANFAWLRYPGYKFAVAFRAPHSGLLRSVTLPWKSTSGYGAGNRGTFTIEVQTDDGVNHFPSGTAVGTTTGLTPAVCTGGRMDGAFTAPLAATLQKGVIYHLVISNTDPNPAANWSSPNTLMTRVVPWDGTGCRVAAYGQGMWDAWSSVDNPFNTTGGNHANGSHTPLMLVWEDQTIWGDPYYSSAVSGGAYIYGTQRAGELIQWTNASTTITRIGVPVRRIGSPGALRYVLETLDGTPKASGAFAEAPSIPIGPIPAWVYADLATPVTLERGATYRLYVEAPGGNSSLKCYYQSIPYGDASPAEWIEAGWGGAASHYIAQKAGKWTELPCNDFSFSLLAEDAGPLRNRVVELLTPDGTAVDFSDIFAQDDTDPSPLLTRDGPALFPLGDTVILWTACDAAGNTATVQQTITVQDTTPPALVAPPDLTQAFGTPVVLGAATVSDLSPFTVRHDAPAVFPVGTTIVHWTATDTSGNMASAQQQVTITPPIQPIDLLSITPSTFNPRNEKATIRFQLPVKTKVTLEILSATGTVIRKLISGVNMAAGTYSRTWDGKTSGGAYVESGVYTFRISGKDMQGNALNAAAGTVTVNITRRR